MLPTHPVLMEMPKRRDKHQGSAPRSLALAMLTGSCHRTSCDTGVLALSAARPLVCVGPWTPEPHLERSGQRESRTRPYTQGVSLQPHRRQQSAIHSSDGQEWGTNSAARL